MPLYEYHCEGCGKDSEEQQSLSFNPAETECPYCYTKKASRKISSFSSSIKGPNRKAKSSDIKDSENRAVHHQTSTALRKAWGL